MVMNIINNNKNYVSINGVTLFWHVAGNYT